MTITSAKLPVVAQAGGARPAKRTEAPQQAASAHDEVNISCGPGRTCGTQLAQQGNAAAEQASGQGAGLAGAGLRGPLRMILIGPPGSGKGTQAKLIQQFFKAPHISTGELLRQEVKQGTELGKEAQVYMQAGKLVPDEIMLKMVDNKLAGEESFILDGFPRSKAQAEHLDETLAKLGKPLTAVANLMVDDEIVVKRLKERGRQDDTEEIIRERLKVYHDQTEPVTGHYGVQALLEPVAAEGSVPQVGYNVITQLNSRMRPQGC